WPRNSSCGSTVTRPICASELLASSAVNSPRTPGWRRTAESSRGVARTTATHCCLASPAMLRKRMRTTEPPAANDGRVRHALYGLPVESNVPIPGLDGAPPGPEIHARLLLGKMPGWLADAPPSIWRSWYVSSNRDDEGEPSLTVWRGGPGDWFRLC